eukprot:TRINITY_DN441_c0_g2_i1.p1 TRINITY_DN441_c0_g2~~TRINITY_DN441_c0_g2_i1.p1  ORF type:complete len:254 (+),score=45.25 TRINITY_DN441_c0_g2_i1:26-763(+)
MASFLLLACLGHALAAYQFYPGLCPGDSDCLCTLEEKCGATTLNEAWKNTSLWKRGEDFEVADPCVAAGGRCLKVDREQALKNGNCAEAVGEKCGTAAEQLLGITRKEVMSRAEEWISKQIPYCQCNGPSECCGNCPYCGSYRCDCSGYVSYTWDLGRGYTTSTLLQVAHKITKEELQEGDAMLCPSEHVALFGGWANSEKTHFYALQEPGCHTSGPHHAFKSVVPYPFDFNPSCFVPVRFNHIQ